MPQSGICFPAHGSGKRRLPSSTTQQPRETNIGVSAITLAEMYLVEKARIPANALKDLHTAIADPQSVLQHIPVDEAVAMKMTEVSRQDIPDLPDRVIAATAYLRGIPVLSRDGEIRSSTITTIW